MMYLDLTKYNDIIVMNKEDLDYKLPHGWTLTRKFLSDNSRKMHRADLAFCHLRDGVVFTFKNRYGQNHFEYEVDEQELARLLLIHG